MFLRPPRSTRTATLFPDTTLFRSVCVVAIERRVAEFRPELDLLVGAEVLRVAVDRLQVVVAGQEITAVRHLAHRRVMPQQVIDRIRVGENGVLECTQIERKSGGWDKSG